MDKLNSVLQILEVGTGLSILFYWIGVLLGKLSTNSHELRWWLRVAVPQGIIIATALKVFKIF